MRHRRVFERAGSTVLGVLLALGIGALAAPAPAATLSLDVSASYEATMTADLACQVFHVVGDGTASGTPIGAGGTWHDEECVNETARPGMLEITGTGFIADSATPPNEITFSYSATASAVPQLPGTLKPSGTYKITGGTGIYQGASGSGSVTADVHLLTLDLTKPVTVSATAHLWG